MCQIIDEAFPRLTRRIFHVIHWSESLREEHLGDSISSSVNRDPRQRASQRRDDLEGCRRVNEKREMLALIPSARPFRSGHLTDPHTRGLHKCIVLTIKLSNRLPHLFTHPFSLGVTELGSIQCINVCFRNFERPFWAQDRKTTGNSDGG